MKSADLYLRYIAEFVDRGATRAVVRSQQQVRRGAAETTAALRATSRQVAASGTVVERVTARQQKEWAQTASAARRADRETARYAINASTTVPRSAVRQAEALRRTGDSYEQIARRMRDHGHTATQTAAVVERAAAREGRAAAATARARQATSQALSQVKAVAGLGVALGFGAAVRDTVAFDRSMRNVNSIAQLSEKNLSGLQKRVLALAGPTAQAPKTLADGLYDLVSSGFKADDAMTVLASSAKAATAGLTTTEVSTKAVAAVINAYHLRAKDAAAVSDTLFQTVNRGVLTFEDLAQNVGDVLPFATTLGVSFKQVGAAISTMTKEGISAPETVTRIKQAMVSFIKPSEGMKAALKGLGVASGEQLIKSRGFQGALEAVIGTTNGSKEAIAKLFPDVRGLGGALALTGKNAKAAHGDLEAFRTGVKGATDRALSQQSKSLAFQWAQMKAAAQAVGITIGQTLLPPLSKAFQFFRRHPEITKVAAGLVAVGVALRALRFTSAITGVTSLGRLLLGLGRTRAGAAVVSAVAGPIGRLAGRLAAPVAGAGRAVLRLGGYGVTAGANLTRAIVTRAGGLARRLASPLATAGGKIIDVIGGAGVTGGARARDSILRRVQGIRPKASGPLLGAFRGLGVALGAAAGIGIAHEIAKALKIQDATTGGSGGQKLNRALGDPQQSIVDKVRNFLGLRRGGVVGYQAGGMVPAMVSPGEMIVHQGRAGIVPGARVAADTVAMMLPVGAAVLTGDGQRMVSQGASIGQAVASQAPHFQTGGHVRGKLSWFGGPRDSQDSGRTALGLTTATPGVAVRPGATWQTGRATLGSYWRVRTPNGRTAVLRQTDLGPNQSTGRRIDLTYSALGRLGYTEGNFPTDSIGVADLVGGAAARAASTAARSYRISGYAAALARRVAPSRVRAGILGDAFDQGVSQGEAGMTRARLRSMGDPVYRAISASYRVPGDKIVRVAGQAAPSSSGGGGRGGVLTRGIRATANSIARRWNVNGRVAEIAALAMQAFPGVSVSSGFRPGAITKSGNRSNHGFHRALDLAATGRRNLALGAWLRRRFPPSFRGVTEGIFDARHDPTGQHGTHVHVAAQGGFFNRYRRGGIARFQTGGRAPRYTYATPGERGTTIRGDEFGTYGQPSRGMGAVLGGAMYPVVRASNAAFAKRFAALNAAIQNAADSKIGALRRGLLSAVRRGGSELAVKRMQQAIDLVDRELGRRIGLLSRRIAARTAVAEQRVTRTDIGLRISGVDPESAQGITARLGAERGRGDALHRTARDLDKQLRLAEKARNLQKISEIRQGIADNQTAILESRANQAELARARAEAQKSARLAFAQGLTDIAGSRTSLAQVGLQGIELTQRLAGTYDTGGQQRADYIRQAIIPDLQAEQAGIRAQGIEAMRQNNADLARQLTQAYAEKQNEILQAQLDAQEATAKNTEDTADAIKNLGGTLGFEFGGARLTDALVQSGIGA